MARVIRCGGWLAMLLLFSGCQNCGKKEGTPPPPVAAADAGAPQEAVRKLAVEDLQPLIREEGALGTIPGKVVVRFARPVIKEEDLHKPVSEKTVFSLGVPGKLSYTDPATLEFSPDKPLSPDTTYTATLTAVDTWSGLLTAPTPSPWVHAFRTPRFGFVSMTLRSMDPKKGILTVDIVLSAPAEARRLSEFSSWKVNGRPVAKVMVDRLPEQNRFTARLLNIAWQQSLTVEFSLRAGLPMAGDENVRAAEARETIQISGDPWQILSATAGEAPTGHYLDFVCDDSGGKQPKRWYWDRTRQQDYQISRRCLPLEADALESIRFEPAAKFSLSPSEGGFRLLGDFRRGSYTVVIPAGLRTQDGGVLPTTYRESFHFPARSPQLQFAAQGRYLPRSAIQSLALRHLNVDQAALSVRHVPAENLVFWMSDDQSDAAGERNSNLILEKTIPLRGRPDEFASTFLDLKDLLPADGKGVFQIEVRSGSARARVRVLLTDMHLLAKRSSDLAEEGGQPVVWAWALHSETLEPVSGAELRLIRKSGQTVGRCTTDRTGACRLKVEPPDVDKAEPFAILAQKGSDITYLKFADVEDSVAEARVTGEPFEGEAVIRAVIYSDRGVYRPGDTAHLAAVLRDERNLAPAAGLPVKLELDDPRGKTVRQTQLAANGAGMIAWDVRFDAFAATGRYRVRAVAGERRLGEYGFQVEEFVPERMKVTARGERPAYLAGESVGVDIGARYLFGGVPAGARVEMACELEPTTFRPGDDAAFHYGVADAEGRPARPLSLGSVTGSLDDKGSARLLCPAPTSPVEVPGSLRLWARVAVFEAGSGRTTQEQALVLWHPERYYLGLSSGTATAEAGQPAAVNGVVVDWNGQPVKTVPEVELQFFRLDEEYDWSYYDEEGGGGYRRYRRPVMEGRQKVKVEGGRFSASFTPSQDASAFLVRARAGNARTDFEIPGRGGYYWWEAGESRVDQTPRPAKAAWLDIKGPEIFRVNETARVTFKAPYRGAALLTIETNQVKASQWKRVEAGEASFEVKVEEFSPNVYLSLLLIKDPRLESKQSFLPDRAFGVKSFAVAPAEFSQELTLEVPKEIRSQSRLDVTLRLAPAEEGSFATVAVVDEGILSLTKFASPDPLKVIFAARALGVQTFETVGWTLLLPPLGPSSATGGDGAESEEAGAPGRVQPVKPVALWSGLVPVPADGKLKLSFEVPQYRGQVRVMAVSASPKRMGRAEAKVLVRDPLVVQVTAPRFLSDGDEFEIPVFVTNLSGQKREVTVRLAAEALPVPGLAEENPGAPVELRGKGAKTLSLANEANGVVVFAARARRSFGAARITVHAESGDITVRADQDVPLLPAGPRSHVVQKIEIADGDIDLRPYLAGWVPMSEQSTFWVTSNPYGEAFDHLRYLVHYPHGCIEQTTSATRPLLFLAEILSGIDPEIAASGKIEEMAQRGIDRVLAMQTPSGGFAFWPGGTEATHWGSAYATHMLLDAKKLGFSIGTERIEDAVKFIEGLLSNQYENQSGSDRGHRGYYWEYDPDAEPYLQYVLAAAGKGHKARMEKLLSSTQADDSESAYLLKAGLYLAGDRRYERDLKNPPATPIQEKRRYGWSFYSERRARGLILSVFGDLFGADPAGEALANLVAEGLRNRPSYWYTTQELVWSITGLGKRLQGAAKKRVPAQLIANGKPAREQPKPAGSKSADQSFALARASEYRELKLHFPGTPEGKLYLILSSTGVREKPDYRLGGEGLEVTRTYRKADGSEIDLASGGPSLGDVAYVELTIANQSGEALTNIALTDRFPAGMEVENPRLNRGGVVEWLDAESQWNLDYLDIRDDRLTAFGSLAKGERRSLVYALRAVTSGRFTLPPVEAEAMYNPQVWARQPGQKITVAGPWQAYLD